MKKPEYAIRYNKPVPPGNDATSRGSGRAIGSYRLSPRAPRLCERGDASVSTAAMRVCQPGPLAFQRASVSGGSRRLMATFASGDLGRPRGFNSRAAAALPMSPGSTLAAGRARRKSATVHSGFSSSINSGLGLRFFITSSLSVIGLARTDDVKCVSSQSEHQHVQPGIDTAQRMKALFTVIPARIFQNQGAVPVGIRRTRERQTTQDDIPRIPGGIETDVHGFNVYTYIQKGKPGLARVLVGRKLAGAVEYSGKDDNRREEKLR
jgi:hypothetical protein